MNLFKPKGSSPPQLPQGPPPPVQLLLHQVVSSLQTNLSNFLHHSPLPFPTAPSLSPRAPLWARISDAISSVSPSSSSPSSSSFSINSDESNKRRSLALSTEAIEERLAGVPVYALSNSSEEFVLVSGFKTGKNLGLFCFSEADAAALLEQMKSMDPSMRNGSQVVAVALNKVFQLKVDGVAFRLIPEVSQIKNAISERQKAGTPDDSFRGVPVFQSKSLALRSQNRRYRPVFFRKEDLENSLQRASRQQKTMNPALRAGDVQVAVLEDIIQGMKDDSSAEWDDIVFIPPGFDVATDHSSRQ
ncbi:hypothetical protein M9H77_31002 [Catharanthus roseus]|uniref:Uncharacterized protein n=1 Tax=Catharanthus roseus TaxID=4058 RepID=A0ACB9ZYT3_CATRO|nr:hypothetical protein M9H77_31002 [Catharanthus roseus]